MSAGDVVGLVLALLALAVSVVALVASRRAALQAERWARVAQEAEARALAVEDRRRIREQAAEFDRQAIAAMRERAEREGRS